MAKSIFFAGDLVYHHYGVKDYIGILIESEGQFVKNWRVFWFDDPRFESHPQNNLRHFNGHKKTYVV